MARQHGITADTYSRLLLDSGAVYKDYGEVGAALIGATRGGNSISIETDYREMPADGAQGPVKGSERYTRNVVKLTVNVIEMTTANIIQAMPGAESSADGTHDTIIRDTQIAAGDYLTNVTLILQKTDTAEVFGIKLLNPLALSNFALTAADADEPVNTMEFTAHYTTADLDTQPWEIFNPLEA